MSEGCNPFPTRSQPVPGTASNPFPRPTPLGGGGNELKRDEKKLSEPVPDGNGFDASHGDLADRLVRAAVRAADGADSMPSPAGSLARARALSEVIRIGRQLRAGAPQEREA